MREYEIRRGLGKALLGDGLHRLVAEAFGAGARDGDKVVASFGAIRSLTTWTDGKSLFVEAQMDTAADPAAATDTIRRYNAFLERATGYTAKERGKREKAKAERGG